MSRRPRTSGLLLGALLGALSAVGSIGCDRLQPPAAQPDALRGPDDPRHLERAFTAVVEAAKRGDEAAVLAELETFLLTREALVALFGPEVGQAVWPGYSDQVAGGLRSEAPAVIIERVRDGYTEVVVDRVGPAYPARTTPGDQQLLDAFVPRGLAMYSVWLRQPGQSLGLRFNGFVYHDGRWRALLKAYEHLPRAAERAPDDEPSEAPADPESAEPEPAVDPEADQPDTPNVPSGPADTAP